MKCSVGRAGAVWVHTGVFTYSCEWGLRCFCRLGCPSYDSFGPYGSHRGCVCDRCLLEERDRDKETRNTVKRGKLTVHGSFCSDALKNVIHIMLTTYCKIPCQNFLWKTEWCRMSIINARDHWAETSFMLSPCKPTSRASKRASRFTNWEYDLCKGLMEQI